MKFIPLIKYSELQDRVPAYAQYKNVDLVVARYNDKVSVLYGRCQHRGALLSDGHIEGNNLICGLHFWDYRYDTGVSEYNNDEVLQKFSTKIENDQVFVDGEELESFLRENPQSFHREQYLGTYADTHSEETEPYTLYIQELARFVLKNFGQHGPSTAMGVDRNTLPKWEDIQILPAQLAKRPLFDEVDVDTSVVIGPNVKKPLVLEMPIFVSDMSFGAISRETKVALSKNAEMAVTGICSGEGGMLPEEQENNSRYFYELASGKFGFSWEKVTAEIAHVRGLKAGEPAISPANFADLITPADYKKVADEVRKLTGGIPIGFKIAVSHIEDDIDFALEASADYIILDGRGGETGAVPSILKDNINVPTIPALARARKHLDKVGAKNITLIITWGLRIADDFAKALMLGADAVAVANSALQAVGCLGMRACQTNNCPLGIATQKENLRSRIAIETSAKQLCNCFHASNQLIKVIARACGRHNIGDFDQRDLTSTSYHMHQLTEINYAGVY